MNKRVYLSPNIKVVEFEISAILAGSGTGATIPDAGWGNAKRRQRVEEIWDESEYDE